MRKGTRLVACKRGHRGWVCMPNGKRRCPRCHAIRQAAFRARAKGKAR